MTIVVKLFAGAREMAGRAWVELELGDQATVEDVRRVLGDAIPQIAPLVARSMVAVNAEYAVDSDSVRAGDDVALIPPVSGG